MFNLSTAKYIILVFDNSIILNYKKNYEQLMEDAK